MEVFTAASCQGKKKKVKITRAIECLLRLVSRHKANGEKRVRGLERGRRGRKSTKREIEREREYGQ